MKFSVKNITCLLLLELLILDIFCNDNIFSKFHQHVFKLRDVRIELINYNKEHFNIATVKTFKYNRTTPVVNGTFNFKVSFQDKIEVVVQVQKFLSNEYRYFPIRFQVNLKKGFDANAIGLGNMKNCGNVTTFYFEKDVTYHFCNFVLDETRFPPLIPNGRFRIDLQMLYLQEKMMLAYIFGEVYIPIEYPKK